MPDIRRLELDAVSVRAMAHPLRVEILRILQLRTRASVTSLAGETGETTGVTSYHLRQLAKHGFVEQFDPDEDAGPKPSPARAGRRQQWWRMAVDEIHSTGFEMLADPATSPAARFVLSESRAQVARDLAHWDATTSEWSPQWQRAHTSTNGYLDLNAKQARAFSDELNALMAKYKKRRPGIGARRVAVQYAVFPAETGDRA